VIVEVAVIVEVVLVVIVGILVQVVAVDDDGGVMGIAIGKIYLEIAPNKLIANQTFYFCIKTYAKQFNSISKSNRIMILTFFWVHYVFLY